MCPNSDNGQHNWDTHQHTNSDGSTVTRTYCTSCGTER